LNLATTLIIPDGCVTDADVQPVLFANEVAVAPVVEIGM
jgi:hypothetical protein